MIKSSKYFGNSQRAAGAGNAVVEGTLNGLMRATESGVIR